MVAMKPSVLVTKRIYPEAIEYLKKHCEVDYVDNDEGITAEQLKERIRGKQAVVAQLMNRFSAEVIDSLDGVKIIANVAVGFDNIDVPAAKRQGNLGNQPAGGATETTPGFAFAPFVPVGGPRLGVPSI